MCDRFADSTLAYQGYGRGFDLPSLRSLLAFATGGLRTDATFLLEASLDTRNERLDVRYGTGIGADRFEREEDDFHRRVREGFEVLAREEPDRILRIETERPVEETAEDIWRRIAERFPEVAASTCHSSLVTCHSSLRRDSADIPEGAQC